MAGILNTVRRTLSMGRQDSPPPRDPHEPVSPTFQQTGEQRHTLNPEQVAALLRGGDGAEAMTEEVKLQFAAKVKSLLERGYEVSVEAVWGHIGETHRQTVIGVIALKGDGSGNLEAKWADEPGMAYDFPFPDINYFSLEITSVRAVMPGGRKTDETPPTSKIITDPAKFTTYEPLTWGPWLESEDELRVRDLIRDLRAAPEFGLLFNSPPIRERLFKIIQEWVYAARVFPMWREEHFLAIVQTAIEELRNHYWSSQGIPIENLQLKLHKEDETKDAYSKVVADEKLRQLRTTKMTKPGLLCYKCHKPGHFRAQCPILNQPVQRTNTSGFRLGVTGGTAGAKRGQ